MCIKILLICLIIQNIWSQSDNNCNCSSASVNTCLANNRICIPELFNDNILKARKHPQPQELIVHLKQLQIISVDDRLKQLTLNMLLAIFWYDDRLLILKENNDAIIHFESSDIKHIWSPALKLTKNLVATSQYLVHGEPILHGVIPIKRIEMMVENSPGIFDEIISNSSKYLCFRAVHFKATILCNLVFGKFPFDIQDCSFEVPV